MLSRSQILLCSSLHLVLIIGCAGSTIAKTPVKRAKKAPEATFNCCAKQAAVIRYKGGKWSLARVKEIKQFYFLTFNRPLPISAFGQTATHNLLGFDHRFAVDVPLHPDSREGVILIAYFYRARIPFLAVRRAIKGSTTGAHIHIGPESQRVSRLSYSR